MCGDTEMRGQAEHARNLLYEEIKIIKTLSGMLADKMDARGSLGISGILSSVRKISVPKHYGFLERARGLTAIFHSAEAGV